MKASPRRKDFSGAVRGFFTNYNMSRSQLGFEVRVLFHERIAIEPVLQRFHSEILSSRGLMITSAYGEEWSAFLTRTHNRSIHDSDRLMVFRWFKNQPEVVKCTVELPTAVKVRSVRDLILSLV